MQSVSETEHIHIHAVVLKALGDGSELGPWSVIGLLLLCISAEEPSVVTDNENVPIPAFSQNSCLEISIHSTSTVFNS